MQDVAQEGNFRGRIVKYGIREEKSGSIGVSVQFLVDDIWDAEAKAWADWREYEVLAEGCLYIIKKDKAVNQGQVDALVKFAGWDGDLMSIWGQTWVTKPCAFTVECDEYENVQRFRVGFLNPYESIPGQFGSITEDRAKALASQYGSQFRALAGNQARNAAPSLPGGKPSPPKGPAKPRRNTPAQKAQAAVAEQGQAEADGGTPLPF
jgi:hypothetical protein